MNNDNNTEPVLYAVGARGYSAYEVAVQNGFVGTEQEWLDSLVGPEGKLGPEGKSAYQVSVDNGFIGTEEEWCNSFLNPDGYVRKVDIVDNLTNTSTDKPLSANQGKVLNNKLFTEKQIREMEYSDLSSRVNSLANGSPIVVDDIADMVDTDQLYILSTDGNWYYYDSNENDWVSGGTYGADSGLDTNSRNLLRYILRKVAYTEMGMDSYVNALYYALAKASSGHTVPECTIMNALSFVTSDNDATGCDEGDSYSATLTPDANYMLDSVTITMDGVDITSTAYSDYNISIDSVTGDLIIIANAIPKPALLYQLASPFKSMGTEYIDTGVQLEVGKTYTFFCNCVLTSLTSPVNMIFGNRVGSNAGYLALQNKAAEIWGAGISWDDRISNLGNKHIKIALKVEVNLDGTSKCTLKYKNATDNTGVQTFTNTYASGSAITSANYYLGNNYGASNVGFKGAIVGFEVYAGEMTSAEIEHYLVAETLLTKYTLETSDLTREAQLGDATPYYGSSAKRLSYLPFDLLLDGGKVYKITATSTYDTALLAVPAYNENALTSVSNNTTIAAANKYDESWKYLTCYYAMPVNINSNPAKAIRMTFRQSSSDPDIAADFEITNVIIEEVTS